MTAASETPAKIEAKAEAVIAPRKVAVNEIVDNARTWGSFLSSFKSKSTAAFCAMFALLSSIALDTADRTVAMSCLGGLVFLTAFYVGTEAWKRVAAIRTLGTGAGEDES